MCQRHQEPNSRCSRNTSSFLAVLCRGLLRQTAFEPSYTGITKDGAEWIVERGSIKFVGLDYLSVAHYADLIGPHVALLAQVSPLPWPTAPPIQSWPHLGVMHACDASHSAHNKRRSTKLGMPQCWGRCACAGGHHPGGGPDLGGCDPRALHRALPAHQAGGVRWRPCSMHSHDVMSGIPLARFYVLHG